MPYSMDVGACNALGVMECPPKRTLTLMAGAAQAFDPSMRVDYFRVLEIKYTNPETHSPMHSAKPQLHRARAQIIAPWQSRHLAN